MYSRNEKRVGITLAYTLGVIMALLRMKTAPARTAELIQALRLLMRSVRAEKGFIAHRLDLDAQDSNMISYEERWRNREDFDDQLRSQRFTRLLALMEFATEQPTLELHFVAETRGLDYIAGVRGEE